MDKNVIEFKYYVGWSETKNEYIGYCVDIPELEYSDPDPVIAMRGIIQLVKEFVIDVQD